MSVSADYGDKLQCAIDITDPGAVPGGSTKIGGFLPILTGPNQDRRVLKSIVFARVENPRKKLIFISANDNEALAVAA